MKKVLNIALTIMFIFATTNLSYSSDRHGMNKTSDHNGCDVCGKLGAMANGGRNTGPFQKNTTGSDLTTSQVRSDVENL